MNYLIKLVGVLTSFVLLAFNTAHADNVYDVQLTINYTNAVDSIIQQNALSLLRTSYSQSSDAQWNPVPNPEIFINSYMSAILRNFGFGDFNGTVSYGIADHCSPGPVCDPNYQFTVAVNQVACSVDKAELGSDSPWIYNINYSSSIIGTSVICTVNVTASPNTNPVQSINVKIMNSSDASGGTLANGLVTLNNKTTCVANDTSGDCNKAVSLPVMPSGYSPVFTFTADPTERVLSGGLVYPIINDTGLPELPVHYVAVHLQNGEQVTDRCKAEITPSTEGPIHYQAQAYQIGADEENTCIVNVTRYVNE